MAQLLVNPEDYGAIQTELRGVIFKDPMAPDDVEAGWRLRDEYLSGDARRSCDCTDGGVTVILLSISMWRHYKEQQPKDLDASEIDVRLGATWIDADDIPAVHGGNL